MTLEEASFAVVYFIFGDRTVVSVLYLGVGAGTITPGLSGHGIVLASSMWIIRPWFIVEVDWSHSMWVVVMGVGLLGLIYCGVGARTAKPRVLGRNILLAASVWRTRPWFIVEVDWSYSA